MLQKKWLPAGLFCLVLITSLYCFFTRHESVSGVSLSSYFFMSTSFSLLLASALLAPFTEFFFVLNTFLFLGFWGKSSVYLLIGGGFSDLTYLVSDETMNRSLYYSGIFALALLLTEILLRYLHRSLKGKTAHAAGGARLSFSLKQLSLICIGILGLCALNSWIGFLRVGLPAEGRIPFPLSLVFSWLMGPGSAYTLFIGMLTLNPWTLALSFGAAMALSFSTLSRNALFYFVYPIAINFFRTNKFSKKMVLKFLGACFFILVGVLGVQQLRWHLYFHRPQMDILHSQPPLLQIRDLLLNRWVGIEGVITAARQPDDQTFWDLVKERPDAPTGRLYVRLSQPDQLFRNDRFLFVSNLPGPAGIIFFPASLGLQVGSMLAFLALLSLSFVLLQALPQGLAASVLCWWCAQSLSQMSLFFLFNLKIFLLYLCGPVAGTLLLAFWLQKNRKSH